MKLKTLLKDLQVQIKGSREKEITGLSSDSRTVSPGNLFIAKKGLSKDGAQFIPQALSGGASAILTDIYDPFLDCPQIIHPEPEKLEAILACRYYGEPSHKLYVVGVTGTKGKTTTTYLIKHLFDRLGLPAGLMGTVETRIGETHFPSQLTTHDPISNQKWLKEMVQKKCKAAIMEVSSHGLDQGRVDQIEFAQGIFTNLTADHLDYHHTIEEYAKAKRKLFERSKLSILNADSPWSSFMGSGITYGIEKGDVRAEKISFTSLGTEFRVDGCHFLTPLIGKFNVYNALAAITSALQTGAKLASIRDHLAQFGSVPARLERIGNVFVDFAHTGEALENVLQTLKEIAEGKIIVVFGCGGNRDPQRRKNMARIADRLADISIVTNDNPRKEDPQEILRQILSGFEKMPLIELDRRKAIEKAIDLASPKDLILIAGKGHERVQIFAHQTIPFDDVAIVKEILQSKNSVQVK